LSHSLNNCIAFPTLQLDDRGTIAWENDTKMFKVPLRRKFVGLFPPNSVAEYHILSIFTQKTEQETIHPNICF